MKGISHKQAVKLIHLRLDGLLKESQSLSLNAHLDSCASCRTYAAEMELLPAHLQNEFHLCWDQDPGPSHKVIEQVAARAKRIPITNRISSSIRLLAGITALVFLGLAINFVVSQMQSNSIDAIGTQSVSGSELIDKRLIAFTSDQGGNAEIYTMYADGSNLTNLTNYSAHDVNPVWSPDGKLIAFESDRTGSTQIYTMNADGSNLTQITNEEADHAIGTKYGNTPEPWSPDGKKIIFSQTVRGDENCMLYVMDVNGRNKIALTGEPGLYTFLSWSPDGQKIVYQTPNFGHNAETRIMIANVDGTSTMDGIVGIDYGITSQIQWESPDQLVLLGYNFSIEPPIWQLSRMFVTTDTSVYNGFGPTIVASNVPIVALFENTYVAEDQDALRWFAFNGNPVPMSPWNFPTVCEKPVSDPFMTDTFHTVSPDRSHAIVVVFCGEGAQFYLENADGTQIDQLGTPITGQSQVTELTWSPDGKHVIVTTSTDSSTNSTNLFRFDVQEMLNDPSVKPIKLTTDDAWKYGVVWQPILNNDIVEEKPMPEPTRISFNAGLILFAAVDGDNTDIYTIRADGTDLKRLTNHFAFDGEPTWSPDGTRIAFQSGRDGSIDIYTMDPDGNRKRKLTTNEGFDGHFTWSPNGQKMVYLSGTTGDPNRGNLYVMNVDGTDKIKITEEQGAFAFRSWSPDSNKIVYVKQQLSSTDVTNTVMYIVNADGANRHELLEAKYINSVFWEDDRHFIGIGFDGNRDQPQWSLYRFSVEGSAPLVLASHTSPIVAIFKNTYAVSDPGVLRWFAFGDNSSPLSSWDFTTSCDHPNGGPLTLNTDPTVSPDRKHFIVSVSCGGTTQFYLENENGSEISKLGSSMVNPARVEHLTWSPDGNFVVATISNEDESKSDLYLLDIQKMLKDPSTQPIQLTTDGALKYNAVWQPILNDEVVEENPTPDLLSFSLTAAEAQNLAGFDILEPTYLSAGYMLDGVAYDTSTQKVAMRYVSQNGDQGMLFIYQQRGDLLHDPAVSGYVTPVPVRDGEGEYIQGAWIYESPDTTIPTWDPRADSYSFTWQNGEFVFSINFIGGETITPLSLNELVAIAESLK